MALFYKKMPLIAAASSNKNSNYLHIARLDF